MFGGVDKIRQIGRMVNNELQDVFRAQRRRRRMGFWAGVGVIVLVGGLWAQLSKDPIGPNFGDFFNDGPAFAEDGVFQEAPAIEIAPQTTIAIPPDLPPTSAVPLPVPLTVPPTTVSQ